ncbi:unnamed protein product [Pseudo-nitzschia multistriata]|uniref:Cyclin C-terminal domain-containing protein n=1 Tax=Pseudo-nitzschia multistriata TaxID=183589 RepID=A0A448Z9E9_9STRA|nr:unnamed protein product [Pseudo-nitzschia multistriata]
MVPNKLQTGCSGEENSTPSDGRQADCGALPLPDDLYQHTIAPREQALQNREVCDPVSSCCPVQSLSDCMKKKAKSSNMSSSRSDNGRCAISDSNQYLSRLQRMIAIERNDQLTANDHRALQGTKNCFHNHIWRERVAQWCYDVVDYLEESRHVASVAMNIVDRYIAVLSEDGSSSAPVVITEFDYEVISFTSLFLAIRVSGSNKELEISQLLELSSSPGVPQAKHIISTGNTMLEKLSWDREILTPNAFLHEFVGMLLIQHDGEINPNDSTRREKFSQMVDFALYLVEVSLCDIYFSNISSSEIALGALALAMICNQEMFPTSCQNQTFFSRFLQTIYQHTSMDINSPHMSSVISRLLHVYNQSQEAACTRFGSESEAGKREESQNNHNVHTNSPHIIADEAERTSDSTAASSPSNVEAEMNFVLESNNPHVNTDTTKLLRPVSPLLHSVRR